MQKFGTENNLLKKVNIVEEVKAYKMCVMLLYIR